MARLKGLVRRLLRFSIRCSAAIFVMVAAYFLLAVAGLLPANTDFRPPTEPGVTIYIVHNGVHTDIVTPTVHPECDWRDLFSAEDFEAQAPFGPWMQFGWGDRIFYVETPTWADVKPLPVARAAFLPTETVMHVQCSDEPRDVPEVRRLRISREQYAALVTQLKHSFRLTSRGRPSRLEGVAYNRYDAFYEGTGTYHLFQTCNCWTGRTLRETGVRVGIWTPFPQSIMWSLPDTTGDEE